MVAQVSLRLEIMFAMSLCPADCVDDGEELPVAFHTRQLLDRERSYAAN